MSDYNLPEPSPDPLLDLIGRYRADKRPHKIDLGVGVYRDDNGATPVLGAVKAAETILLKQQESKSYLGLTGDVEFVNLLGNLIFREPDSSQAVPSDPVSNKFISGAPVSYTHLTLPTICSV